MPFGLECDALSLLASARRERENIIYSFDPMDELLGGAGESLFSSRCPSRDGDGAKL